MIKNYNIVVTIILLIVMFFSLRGCRDNVEFKRHISDLERSKDSLSILYQKQQKVADSLFKIKQEVLIEYVTIYKTLKPIQDAQDNVNDSVYSLDEQQIDSTIRAYKHPVRN